MYYHVRQVLKRLQVPLPHEASFKTADNPHEVPHDPMRYWDEKFYWTYQRGVRRPDDYIGSDSIIPWIIEKS